MRHLALIRLSKRLFKIWIMRGHLKSLSLSCPKNKRRLKFNKSQNRFQNPWRSQFCLNKLKNLRKKKRLYSLRLKNKKWLKNRHLKPRRAVKSTKFLYQLTFRLWITLKSRPKPWRVICRWYTQPRYPYKAKCTWSRFHQKSAISSARSSETHLVWTNFGPNTSLSFQMGNYFLRPKKWQSQKQPTIE